MFDCPASTQRSPTNTLRTAPSGLLAGLTWQWIVYGPPTGTPISFESAWLKVILALPGVGLTMALKSLPSFTDSSSTIGISALPLESRW